MTTNNSEFALSKIQDDEMALSEHIEEFSQRLIFCLITLILSSTICFIDIKPIVQIFQVPAMGIKFLQFAPGEYFFASLKIAVFCGILASSPFSIYQLFLYIVPGMTKKEREIVLPVTFGSCFLFLIGICFAYFFLVPAALKFFIAYGADIVEPFWSFNQYFDFVATLIFTTGFKPVSSIKIKQNMINSQGMRKEVKIKGKHDPCVVPRAVPIVESMTSMVILDYIFINNSRTI